MDWGELISHVKNNPEVRAMVARMRDAFEKEGPAVEEQIAPKLANKSAEESAQVMGSDPTLSEQLTPDPNVSKSAEQSAQELNRPANIVPRGENGIVPTEDQTPHSDNLPAQEASGNVPALRNAAQTPEVLSPDEPRDVTDTGETTDITPASGLSGKQKALLGGGAVGLAALGLTGDSDDNGGSGDDGNHPMSSASNPTPIAAPVNKDNGPSPDDVAKTIEEYGKDEPDSAAPSRDTASDDDTDASDSPAQNGNYLDFSNKGNGQSDLGRLLDAQAEQVKNINEQRDMAQIAAGIARVNPDLSDYDRRIQMSGLPIEQYLLKNKEQANDPNSGISSGMRSYMAKLGINVSPGATATQINSVAPFIFKDIEAKQAQQAKHEDITERMQEAMLRHKDALAQTYAYRDLMRQDKLDKQSNDMFKQTVSQAESVRGNKAIQNDMETIRRVQNAMNVIKMYKNPNDIPQNIINVLNTDLATIVGGGNPSEGMLHEVATPTVISHLSNGMQILGNKPTGAKAAAFVKQNSGILTDLAGNAEGRLHDRYRRIGNTMGRSLTPQQREFYRQEYLPNDVMDDNGGFMKAGTAGQTNPQQSGFNTPPSWQSPIDQEISKRGVK